jgi:predicted O-methyltransferase YrrM
MMVFLHYLLWKCGCIGAQTQTSDAERLCIARHAMKKKQLVEIGVWHGVTTKLIRSVMAEDGTLFAVDPFPRGRFYISFQQCIAHSEVEAVLRGYVKWIRFSGAEALQTAQTAGLHEVDFIFVDGDHSFNGLRQDWELWAPLIMGGGVVALHDSCPTPTRDLEQTGSVIYTREHILPDSRFRLIEQVDSLTVLRRNQ